MRSEHVRLFQTLPHTCGYYAERTAQNLVIDPAAPQLDRLYGPALERGFRRAGGHLYFPHCPECRACTPCRIDALHFEPDRAQRRCLKRNADLVVTECQAGYNAERHALYERYLRQRHPGGGMDEADASDFRRFLTAPWSPTVFLEFRLHGRLLGVAVTDVCRSGLSAVYTFYDPDEERRSLGRYAILWQIAETERLGLYAVYLGYWIKNCRKMNYKTQYRPIELFVNQRWVALS